MKELMIMSGEPYTRQQNAQHASGLPKEYRGRVLARGDLGMEFCRDVTELLAARENLGEHTASSWSPYVDVGAGNSDVHAANAFRLLARSGAIVTRVLLEIENGFPGKFLATAGMAAERQRRLWRRFLSFQCLLDLFFTLPLLLKWAAGLISQEDLDTLLTEVLEALPVDSVQVEKSHSGINKDVKVNNVQGMPPDNCDLSGNHINRVLRRLKDDLAQGGALPARFPEFGDEEKPKEKATRETSLWQAMMSLKKDGAQGETWQETVFTSDDMDAVTAEYDAIEEGTPEHQALLDRQAELMNDRELGGHRTGGERRGARKRRQALGGHSLNRMLKKAVETTEERERREADEEGRGEAKLRKDEEKKMWAVEKELRRSGLEGFSHFDEEALDDCYRSSDDPRELVWTGLGPGGQVLPVGLRRLTSKDSKAYADAQSWVDEHQSVPPTEENSSTAPKSDPCTVAGCCLRTPETIGILYWMRTLSREIYTWSRAEVEAADSFIEFSVRAIDIEPLEQAENSQEQEEEEEQEQEEEVNEEAQDDDNNPQAAGEAELPEFSERIYVHLSNIVYKPYVLMLMDCVQASQDDLDELGVQPGEVGLNDNELADIEIKYLKVDYGGPGGNARWRNHMLHAFQKLNLARCFYIRHGTLMPSGLRRAWFRLGSSVKISGAPKRPPSAQQCAGQGNGASRKPQVPPSQLLRRSLKNIFGVDLVGAGPPPFQRSTPNGLLGKCTPGKSVHFRKMYILRVGGRSPPGGGGGGGGAGGGPGGGRGGGGGPG